MNDEMKQLVDINDCYFVDTKGNVYSNHGNGMKKLKVQRGFNDYLCVTLYSNKKHNTYFVHRLIAKAFIPNPKNKSQVNHRDGNKQNNCVDNLEWVTPRENTKHAYDNGLTHLKVGADSPNAIKINQYDLKGNFIKTWGGATCVRNELKINKSNIIQCCKGKVKTAGGYIWKYYNES